MPLIYGLAIGTMIFWVFLFRQDKYAWKKLNTANWAFGAIVVSFVVFPLIRVDWSMNDFEPLIEFYSYPLAIGIIIGSTTNYIAHIVFISGNDSAHRN